MPITINTYCRINRNGSININTDPTFPEPINLDNFACVVVGPDERLEANGTYTVIGTSTEQGVTRSVYQNANGWTIQLISNVGGPTWAIWDNDFNPVYISTTQPVPTYPWQASGWNSIGGDLRSVTQGPC